MSNNPQTRYRHRTAEIEAVQWTGDNEPELSTFCSPFDFQTIDPEDRVEDPDQTAAVRESVHGTWQGLAPGDWVVKRGKDFYALSAADFAERYEPAVPVPPATHATGALLDRIAAAMREHYLCTNRDEADADGNMPCRCGDWREPGPMGSDEDDWDAHLAEVALAVLPPPAARATDTFTPADLVTALRSAGEERDKLHEKELADLREKLASSERIRENADFHLGQEMARRQLAEKKADRLRDVLRRMADEAQQPEPPERNFAAYQAAIVRVALVLREARKHREQTDPSERQDCVMCGADHFAEIRDAIKGKQPDTETQAPVEDPARIDRLRPEFFEHASVEAIDSQIRRAQTQRRAWGDREQALTTLRQARVTEMKYAHQPTAEAGQDGAQQ